MYPLSIANSRRRCVVSPWQALLAAVLLLALPACGAVEEGAPAAVADVAQPKDDPATVLAGIEQAARRRRHRSLRSDRGGRPE